MKKAVILFLVIIIFGCSSNKSTSNSSSKGYGFIAGTLTIIDEKPRFNAYNLEYKTKGKKITMYSNYHIIHVNAKGMGFKLKFSPDYSIGNKRVYLFVKEHKVGEYEFFNYDLFTNLGLSQSHLKSKSEFSLPFNVQKDSINYIGDFLFYPNGNENGKLFELSDKYSRDSLKFKEKYPTRNWKTLQNKTIKKGVLYGALLEFN